MVMQSIDLCDELVLAPTADASLQLSCDHPFLPTDGSNLILRAAALLRGRSGLPELGARMQLRKRIPIGAGLAGGSSNGAAALVGLNCLWGLGLGPGLLAELAAELGSDMPFCLDGGTQLCFGRGERLEPLAAPASAPAVLLIKHPEASVSTPWAYGRCREQCSDRYLHTEADFERRREALRRGALLGALQEGLAWPALRNDLQPVVASELPVVAEGLAILQRANGALATAMSGSGPSLFAVFDTIAAARAACDQLRAPLAEAGFEAWSCATISDGVRVVSE
jgi:4-diphosphocytidyl-2-C-methyl-D-erythritol kinase